jgi:NAD(P)-dependent dehydrogenase (short-subunit alcohol dehydrogenase family)
MNNQNMLITGAAKRIGKELALYFAEKKYNILIHYNNSKEEAKKLCDDIKLMGVNSEIIQANFTNENDVKNFIPRAFEIFGNIDILVNNASMFENDYFTDVMKDKWQEHMQTNLRAPLALISDFYNKIQQKAVIINILDYCVLNMPKDNFFSYGISRKTLFEASKILSIKLAPKLRINCVAPGPTLSNDIQNIDLFYQSVKANPLEYVAQVTDICDAVDYFINAKAVTGQIISLDGGRHLSNESYF